MLKFKQKLLLFATIGFIIAINTACEDNNNPPTPPKWGITTAYGYFIIWKLGID